MAIDTAAKRSSCLDHEEVWQFGMPLPDGAIGQGDRQHLVWTYSGILAGVVVLGDPDAIWNAANRGLTWTADNRPLTWTAANRPLTWTATDNE